MTRIDFYSLTEGSRGDRFLLTCRLVERIHQHGQGRQAGLGGPANGHEQARHTHDNERFCPDLHANQASEGLPGNQAGAASEAGPDTHGGQASHAGQASPGNRRPPRIHIQLTDPVQAEHLDRLLWTYDDQSFLPHGRIGQADPELTPILIGATPLDDQDQVLINLDPGVPLGFSRFERLCEPLDLDPTVTAAGRERYRYYRDRGYPLHHHQIRL